MLFKIIAGLVILAIALVDAIVFVKIRRAEKETINKVNLYADHYLDYYKPGSGMSMEMDKEINAIFDENRR